MTSLNSAQTIIDIKAWQEIHSVENMVAEVTLHNYIEMTKNCFKNAKICPKFFQKLPKTAKYCPILLKIDRNCPKLNGYPSNNIYHTVKI